MKFRVGILLLAFMSCTTIPNTPPVNEPRTRVPEGCTPLSGCLSKPMKMKIGKVDKTYVFSKHKGKIYFSGVKTDFDAASFKPFELQDCPAHLGAYVMDKNDVYIASPQSCGSCGSDYTGYYWAPLGIKHLDSFSWISGGYARDGERILFQWEPDLEIKADPKTFQVLHCGIGRDNDIIAMDKNHYFVEGRIVEQKIIDQQFWARPRLR